jgi:hypothetical protein
LRGKSNLTPRRKEHSAEGKGQGAEGIGHGAEGREKNNRRKGLIQRPRGWGGGVIGYHSGRRSKDIHPCKGMGNSQSVRKYFVELIRLEIRKWGHILDYIPHAGYRDVSPSLASFFVKAGKARGFPGFLFVFPSYFVA